jgi:hypothetical protein
VPGLADMPDLRMQGLLKDQNLYRKEAAALLSICAT